MTGVRVACGAALLLAAMPAAAHEVLHEVERGRALAVHATYADGEPLAYCEAQVFSPADPRIPYWKGRTDRSGWVAFVPDAPGKWRVRVADSSGHGLVVDVDAGAAAAAAPRDGGRLPATVGFVLRPLVGLAAIAGFFGLLWWRSRRRALR